MLECKDCKLVFLNKTHHISNNFYEKSGMHEQTNITIKQWLKQSKTDDLRRFKALKNTISGKDILDVGCGAAGFLLIAKEKANSCSGVEPERRIRKYYLKKIRIFKSLNQVNKKYDVITLFHVLEHLKNPVKILKSLKKISKKNAKIIIEVPNSDDALLSIYKSKPFQNFTYWSNHLYLFNNDTLQKIVQKSGLRILKLLNIQRYPFSNTLYWLLNKKPNGHIKFTQFNDVMLNKKYEALLAQKKATDTIFAVCIKNST